MSNQIPPKNMTVRQIKIVQQFSNEIKRWIIVGAFNVLVFWSLYAILFKLNLFENYNEVYSWAISFIIGSIVAHYTHRRITFRSDAKYMQSFWRAMVVYTTSFTLSTTSEYFMVESLQVDHIIALVVNTTIFGALGFFGMRFFAFKVPILPDEDE